MPLVNIFKSEITPSLILVLCAIVALFVANSNLYESYNLLLQTKILGLTVLHWINDGLMVIFFFFVGLEIKREIASGELSTFQKASLPISAAIGGMLAPALIYLYLNEAQPERNGWGIPMATDIAFAVGLLAFFGKRVPLSVKIFLLAVAIVDDLGAILVIALFYTNTIKLSGLTLAMMAFGIVLFLQKMKITAYVPYIIVGVLAWGGILSSGIHATIAGVILGILTPMEVIKRKTNNSFYPVDDLIHKLHHWVSYAIMPLFALANAGVNLSGVSFGELAQNKVFLGNVLGLFIGKPLGVFIFSYLACKIGISKLPKNFNWSTVFSIGVLAGIGFTMSLFISNLALPGELEIYSKVAIVTASGIAALTSAILLFYFLPKNSN